VRRAMAIQLIINREWGLSMNENPLQGSFVIDELTDLVEDAVLAEFDRISERGGVLGAMETGYQRGKIQDESMLYEHRKHDGTLPIVGVNTFVREGSAGPVEIELARATEAEKKSQLDRLADFRARPEHSRWRAYALISYFMVVAATLAGQLYTDNVLSAYVRVQRVELPAMTQIFVRNDSGKSWRDVRIVLNGIYQYRTDEVIPGGHVMLPVNKFAIRDQLGKPTFAPRNIAPKTLLVDTSGGRYETEFRE